MFSIEHVCLVKDVIPPIIERLDVFLNKHLLHWFEAMSILGRVGDVITLLNNLSVWITVSFSPLRFSTNDENLSLTDNLSQPKSVI
jgi:hypothetical protein